MLRRRSLLLCLITVLCTLAAALAYEFRFSFAQKSELLIRDAIVRHGRLAPADPRLVFLAIDQDSISLDEEIDIKNLLHVSESDAEDFRALHLMSRGWPWPREIYAHVLDRLARAGASVVVFD